MISPNETTSPPSGLIVRADARSLPLPDESVDLIVTSPPYYALRDYRDGDGSLARQIGAEPTPAEYIAALIDATREWVRVLKPSGSIFVVLGDKYSDRADGGPSSARSGRSDHAEVLPPGRSTTAMARRKSLLCLPERYRIACIDQLRLIVHAVGIWSKPNGLPESVTDRWRRSHEDIVHLVKRERYYSAVDEIREPHAATLTGRRTTGWKPGPSGNREIGRGTWDEPTVRDFATNALGRLPGSVWEIATQPLKVPEHLAVDHFAAFPPALVRRIVLGWSPPGICTACGEGRRPVVDLQKTHAPRPGKVTALTNAHGADGREGARPSSIARITGYACACPTPDAPTRPALVADPFGGTGTTALVAAVHGRVGVSFDLSHDYGRLARWRTTDPGERARALGVPKPAPVAPKQGDLFDILISKGEHPRDRYQT